MKRILILVATTAALIVVPSTAQASGKVLDVYCSPTGDYCMNIQRSGSRVTAEIKTFAFTGKYELCVNPPKAGSTCRTFRLRASSGGIYKGRVRLSKHFNLRRNGRYAVSFRYSGNKVGQTLHFKKG